MNKIIKRTTTGLLAVTMLATGMSGIAGNSIPFANASISASADEKDGISSLINHTGNLNVVSSCTGWGKVTENCNGYSYTDGKMVKKGNVSKGGCRIGGTKKVGSVTYRRIDAVVGDEYVGYWVNDSKVLVFTVAQTRQKIANLALKYATTSYKNEKYVLGGETWSDTTIYSDCSGLVKHCYGVYGVPMVHKAAGQAEMGTIIYNNMTYKGKDGEGWKKYKRNNDNKFTNYSKLQPGDLLVYHEGDLDDVHQVKHIGIYVGKVNGKHSMAHFTSRYGVSNNPCRIESLASFQNKFPISRVVRIVN